jgi:hypothetical protein
MLRWLSRQSRVPPTKRSEASKGDVQALMETVLASAPPAGRSALERALRHATELVNQLGLLMEMMAIVEPVSRLPASPDVMKAAIKLLLRFENDAGRRDLFATAYMHLGEFVPDAEALSPKARIVDAQAKAGLVPDFSSPEGDEYRRALGRGMAAGAALVREIRVFLGERPELTADEQARVEAQVEAHVRSLRDPST